MSNRRSVVGYLAAILVGVAVWRCGVSNAAEPIGTQSNFPTEIEFVAAKDYADPFNEVTVDLTFTDPNGKARKVPAFWAGGRKWKVRYASPLVGAHAWKSESNKADDTGLNGATGQVDVAAYEGKNPLLKHGPVRVAANKRHFEYADGTPFFWLGDTWWMGLCHRLHFPDEFQQLAANRKDKGFNVIQIVAGLYPDMHPFDPRGANEAGFPWEKDYARIRPEYFDAADQRLKYLVDQGFTPCIVGAWGYFLPMMGEAKMKAHWRYLIARYGAMPVVWCAAGEGNLPWYLAKGFPYDDREQVKGWTEVLRYIRAPTDPFERPLTIHPTGIGPLTSRHATDDANLLTFDMLQTPHGQREAVPVTVSTVRQSYAAAPMMPVINGEAAYEMLGDSLPTQWTRAMFWLCLTNGAGGHTYGANGIWQCNRRGQPHGPSPHHNGGNGYGVIPWDDAMNLPGSAQVGYGKQLFQSLPWTKLTPMPDTAVWGDVKDGQPAGDPLAGPQACGIGDELRVAYAVDPRPIVIKKLKPNAKYELSLFDPVTGERGKASTVNVDGNGELPCQAPGTGHDWVAIVEGEQRVAKKKAPKPKPAPASVTTKSANKDSD